MQSDSPKWFLLKVLFWLPILFTAWYWSAAILLIPTAWLSELFLLGVFPELFEGLEQTKKSFEVVTQFNSDLLSNFIQGQPIGVVSFPLNALKYCYGVPLSFALTLAVAGAWQDKIFTLAIIFGLLLPFQAWGVCAESLVNLVFKLGPQIAAATGIQGPRREILALCYQMGYLIVPSVVPVIIWAAFHRQFLDRLISGVSKNQGRHSK